MEAPTSVHHTVRPQIQTLSFSVLPDRAPQLIDITEKVERLIAQAGVSSGFAVVFCRHTTAAIRINENEPLLLSDMEEFLERVAPRERYYRHNDFSIRTHNMTDDECPNGHAHCQHLLLGASEVVPLQEGRLSLGRWQRLFLVELDRPGREREVLVQLFGCA